MAVFYDCPRSGFLLLLMFSLSGSLIRGVDSEPTEDRKSLLAFYSAVPHSPRLLWNQSDSACNWVGVVCDSDRAFVTSLHLPAVGLVGQIPAGTIGRLTHLRVLSLRSNGLSGPIPPDFSNLTMIRSVFLQENRFSGEFPGSLTRLTRLTRLDLSGNNFTGPIPFEVNNLTHLTGLFLQKNGFSGSLPSINPPALADFNVSNNRLNGSIPKTLSKFSTSSFSGNLDLCGRPLPPCITPFFPSPSPAGDRTVRSFPAERNNSGGLSRAAIIAISVGSALALFLLLLILFLCIRRRKSRKGEPKPPKPAAASRSAATAGEAGTSSSKDDITGASTEERNRLVFFDGGVYSFDLEDLLRASAEVLGKGSVGTSYKAVLEEGTTVVVKRLKDVGVTKREFELQMDVLGKIRHENVVPLRAFYYSKDEKLLVCDYMPTGSLSALLHGNRGSGRSPLDWDSRMKIALTSARGLAHLHLVGKVTHGNIKSSNILLRPDHDSCLSDFGLNVLLGAQAPPNRVAGYRAPEVVETRRATFQSDVYSFGVLVLELLTGKAPNQASLGDEGIDLPRWVQSVVREEWTAEVFDVELMRYHNIEEDMVQLLQVAMACVSTVPDQRPPMQDVVKMIEDVNRGSSDDGLRPSSDDPSKGSDHTTPPTEGRTPVGAAGAP